MPDTENSEQTSQSEKQKPIILIAGDVSFDWLWFQLSAEESKKRLEERKETGRPAPNWLKRPQVVAVALHGGAWYMDNVTRMLWSHQDHRNRIYTYRRFSPEQMRAAGYEYIIHTDTGYAPRAFMPCLPVGSIGSRLDRKIYRVTEGPTYFGVEPSKAELLSKVEETADRHPHLKGVAARDLPRVTAENGVMSREGMNASEFFEKSVYVLDHHYPNDVPAIVVLHDENNGFSLNATRWQHLLPLQSSFDAYKNVNVVLLNLTGTEYLQTRSRGGQPPMLWDHLKENGYLSRTVAVVSANDLRRAGLLISKSISWERTAHDFLSQIDHPILQELTQARHVIVRFGLSGVIHYIKDNNKKCILYYDPQRQEGDYRQRDLHGAMFGYNAIVTATLATSFLDEISKKKGGLLYDVSHDPIAAILETGDVLKQGLANGRAYFRQGSGTSARDLHRRLEREWDQMGNCALDSEIYPPKLCLYIAYLFKKERLQQRRLCGCHLEIAQKRPWKDRFDNNNAKSEREHGGDSPYPECVIHELALRMLRRLNSDRRTESKWEPRLAESNNDGQAAIDICLADSWQESDESWHELAADFEKLLSDNDRKLAGSKAQQLQKDMHDQAPEHTIHDRYLAWSYADKYLENVNEEVARTIDWDFGWPCCVRAFEEDWQCLAKVDVKPAEEWVILRPTAKNLREIAEKIVKVGVKKAFGAKPLGPKEEDSRFPILEFGNLVTVDRNEIESYRSVRNLMREYLVKKDAKRPLSLAVFGPPGSGKSFGVKEIANSIDPKRYVPLEYNLTQLAGLEELVKAFIVARDKSAEGIVPLVFFDEFDTRLGGEPLGWLRYFLSVMQDGKYRFGGQELGIGRAILVFAGGTSHTYQKFTREGATVAEVAEFDQAKGPDFVSRLRGYVDIIGPNRRTDSKGKDNVFVIRRACTLRGLLQKHYPRLVENHAEAAIDTDVLRAMLLVSSYKHGARSIEAILEMSTLTNAEYFDKTALPPKAQLVMHLDENAETRDDFFRLLGGHGDGATD
jgi:hypothetical protein